MEGVVTPTQLGDIETALAALVGGLRVDLVTPAETPPLIEALARIGRLAAGGQMLLARKVDQSTAPADAGLRNGAEWLAKTLGTSSSAGHEMIAASSRLEKLPATAKAAASGVLSADQTKVIAAAADADPESEAHLLELVGKVSVKELRDECARIRAAADPDPEATRRRLHRERRLRMFRDAEGFFCLNGRGTPETGAEMKVVLDALIDEIFHEAHDEGRQETREAYSWDALVEMARRAWALMHQDDEDEHPPTNNPPPTPDTDTPTGKPTADQTATGTTADPADPSGNSAGADTGLSSRSADTPDGGTGSGCAPARAGPGPVVGAPRKKRRKRGVNPRFVAALRIDYAALVRGWVEGDEICDIPGTGPISIPAARALLDQSIIELLITRGEDVLTRVHVGRGLDAAQKIAARWQFPQCARLGCPNPAAEWDHRNPYAQVRTTTLGNTDGLCHHDHDLKTHHGWALVPGTGKRPMVPPTHPQHPGNPTHHPKPTKRNHPPTPQPAPRPETGPKPETGPASAPKPDQEPNHDNPPPQPNPPPRPQHHPATGTRRPRSP